MSAQITVGTLGRTTGWSMVWGLMCLCGILAISLPLATSIGVVMLSLAMRRASTA